MEPDEILLETEEAMEKGVDYMTHEFSSVRTGKASPAIVENIDVEAYGSQMKLKQLALITTPEPRLLVIQPFDASTTKDIERAIKESKVGINPTVDGKDHPHADPAASGGTAQGSREKHQANGRGGTGAGALRPPRRAGWNQESAKGREGDGGRSRNLRKGNPEAHRCGGEADRRCLRFQGSRDHESLSHAHSRFCRLLDSPAHREPSGGYPACAKFLVAWSGQ
jgi:hypothetical protein